MNDQRSFIRTGVSIGILLAVSTWPAANAQAPAGGGGGQARGGGGRGGGAPLYTPAPGAKDLKAVLFNWAWYMGMLRSSEERYLLMSLEYQGKGTVQVDGQPCNATKYRTSISYQTSGERIQYTGTRPNGQPCSNVEVLSGAYAWNEDIPGAELVKGKGKATPMPATVEERMIRLWANPQGAFKAAMAGTSDPPEMAPRPQRVPADVAKAGKTSVAWEGNKPSVTFPIPGVPNATATATLNDKFMPERVVVKNGANTYEFTYSDYKDWNNPLNPAEALYAGKITEKKNGTVVRHHDDADGNGTDVCRYAGSGKHQGSDQTNQSACQLDSQHRRSSARDADCRRHNSAAARRTSGHDRELVRPTPSDWREWHPSVWSNAGQRCGNQSRGRLQRPDGQFLGGL